MPGVEIAVEIAVEAAIDLEAVGVEADAPAGDGRRAGRRR